ncbi:MAG: stalk domain-containing protein [Peptostreptococcaceae bacterium]|nr:stalk domain-containing protein [Peptostreptococcaceae bacterium]
MHHLKKSVIVLITLLVVSGIYYHKNTVSANKTFVNLLEINVNGVPNEQVTSEIELIFDDDPGYMEEGRVVIQGATISKVRGEGNVRVLELTEQTFYDQQEIWLQFLWHSSYKDVYQQAHKVRVNQAGSHISFLRAELRRDEDNPRNGTVTTIYSGDPGDINDRTKIFGVGDKYIKEEIFNNRNIRVYRFENIPYDHELDYGAVRRVEITHNVGAKLISPSKVLIEEVSDSPTDIIEVAIDSSIASQEFKAGDFGFSVREDDIEVESVSVQDGKALLKINQSVPKSQKLDIRFQPSKEQPLYYKSEPIENSFVATGEVNLGNREATITVELNGELENKVIETTPTDSAGFEVAVIENGVVDDSKKVEIEKIETKENKIVLHVESENVEAKEEVKVSYTPTRDVDKQLQFAPQVQRNGIFRIIPLSETAQKSRERLIAKLINKQKEAASQKDKTTTDSTSDLSKEKSNIKPQELKQPSVETETAPSSVVEEPPPKIADKSEKAREKAETKTQAEDVERQSAGVSSQPEQKSAKDSSEQASIAKVRPDGKKKYDSIIEMTIGNPRYYIFINDKVLEGWMDVPPQIYQDRTMLPARKIAELLDAKVDFDHQNKIALFSYTRDENAVGEIRLHLRENHLTLSEEVIPLSADVLLSGNRILLPVSDVQKAMQKIGLQSQMNWEENNRSVRIYK